MDNRVKLWRPPTDWAPSETRDQFRPKELPVREQVAPQQYQPNDAPFNAHTTYGDDFTPKPIQREEPVPMREAPPSPPFDSRTSYQDDYGRKPLPQRSPRAEQPRWEGSGPFQGQSEAHDKFRPHQIPKPEVVPMREAPPQVPFNAHTTYQDEYGAKPLPRREAAVPQQWEPSPAKFVPNTTYGDDFTQKPIQREEPVPMRAAPPSPPFDSRTSYQDDYGRKPLPERSPRAEQPRWEGSGPFQGQSEAHDQFRPWEIPKPEVVPQRPAPPSPAFDSRTSYQDDYDRKPLPKREVAAPQQYQPNDAPFNPHTTYGDDFTPKPIQREEPVPMREPPPSAPFDAHTTYQDEYGAKPLPKRESVAPQEWHPSPGKFHAQTEYGDNFHGWKLPPSKPGLGISLVDGSFYSLIPAGWEPPTRASVVVTSVVDGQYETLIQVLQGSAATAADDDLIGQFTLEIPPAPEGTPQVEVVFVIDEDCTLHVAARDRSTGESRQIIVSADQVSPVK